ncbi:uncharacterized protein TRIVIDRAFT_64744 [Trichoderma virens Gv29-8]|uniref:Uncharacterized protein n=1 Tax=Hypocrea virens (strain Gv29-8 / FGSC 10586) TaxID=413071 RepID=G9NCB7_HYPVG|nr:uncharacterized protein TRIVIDRAFT_64744 [Trichoderma virens Gv29-8]EHK15341.1 hypothetical protein TRIVIDRAFT_64744 [Trichoderma virens Gv29-8]UKZ51287.1 hypothetical protein TrVGV298_005045 [Trichoderma virens]
MPIESLMLAAAGLASLLPTPGEVASAITSIGTEPIKNLGIFYQSIQEGEAARQQASTTKILNKHLPDQINDNRNYMNSLTELNHAKISNVRQLKDHWERMADAQVRCLDTIEQTAGSIDGAVWFLSKSFSKSFSTTAENIQKDARSINEAVSSTCNSVSEPADSIKKAAQEIVPEIHGVRLIAKSLSVSVVAIAAIMEQLLEEVKQVNHNLANIREELWRTNVLTSSGGAGKSGFAEIVYNFVDMEAGRAQYKNDCFFVWHPDTSWHPAFYAKAKDTPLPATFLGESDCLDRLYIAMKALRQGMREQGNDPSDVTFHVLIPSWYNITLTDPLHFPDEVLPLRLVGPKHDGSKPLVSFVLPHPQTALTLQAVANIFEEKPLDRDTAENIQMTTIVTSSLGTSAAGVIMGEMAIRARVLGSHRELHPEGEEAD